MNLIVFETTLDSCSLVFVNNPTKQVDPWFGTFPSTFSVGITILVDLAFIDAKANVRNCESPLAIEAAVLMIEDDLSEP